MLVTFLPAKIEQAAQWGDNLMDIAARANVLIDGTCGSKGICGKCKVRVIEGRTAPPDAMELLTLTDKEIEEGYRLACRLAVEDDLVVVVPEINTAHLRKTRLFLMPRDFAPEKRIAKHFIRVKPASLDCPESDVARLFAALPGSGYSIEPSLLPMLPAIAGESEEGITVVEREGRVIGLEAGDTTRYCYGIAFDIGTTTVVGMLWDLSKGQLVGTAARTNPQGAFGADVISRIHYSSQGPENLLLLKEKIRDCFNEIIAEFADHHDLRLEEIYDATVVGNTTMSHLFLGVSPAQLARAPFAPVFCQAVAIPAKELGLDMNPLADVYLLPNIAGHVGSDIVGVMLSSRVMERPGLNLVVDIGTNGEIVLARDGKALACSTAAGPAFEGAAIHQGMRAAQGAIEAVRISEEDVLLDIIDSAQAVGICGSGLIDAVAELLKAGIVDEKGRLLSQEQVLAKGISPSLAGRVREGQNGREFVLARGEEEDIVITQKDIREVQLAKGAIYAGIHILLKEAGAGVDDLSSVLLAGAFGNYIDKESAIRIGLLPQMPPEKIIPIGNGAGAGASMALLSRPDREKATTLAQRVVHVELAQHPDFQQQFMQAMYFPPA